MIGAGLAGAFVAWFASRAGWAVTVLERDQPASGASGAAVGALHPLTGMRLSLREDNLSGFRLTRDVIAQVLPAHHVTRGGVLRLACKPAQATLWAARCRDFEPELATWLDRDACLRLEPRLAADVQGAAWIPQGMFVDVPALVTHLLVAADARVVAATSAVEIDESGDSVRVVVDDGSGATRHAVRATAVVVTTGADAPAPLTGVDLPTAPYKGELALFRGFTPPALPLNHRGYVVGRPDGSTLVGVLDSHPPFHDPGTAAVREGLLERLHAIFQPDGSPELVTRWHGVRPAMRNREPWAGRATGHDRTWICTGFGGRGLLIGAITARRVVEELTASLP